MITKSIFRWAGGKNWLKSYLDNYLPERIENYYEPFVGGGSIFLYIKSKGIISKKAFLSDINKDLINAYKVIKSCPEELYAAIIQFRNTESDYYKIRDANFDNNIENAAKFIYLNRTSFNGIYRVNSKGIYNVPYGYRKLPEIANKENLYELSEAFRNTYFSSRDFKKIESKVQRNDFVYIDPPYTVAHENNGFVQYNQSLFSWKNQQELAEMLSRLNEKKIHFVLSNASHESIIKLYKDNAKIVKLQRASTIGGIGAKRQKYNELLIVNNHG